MSASQKTYTRFSLAQRIEHLVLILSFTILAITGMPQKFPLSPISQFVVESLGGIQSIRVIHRVAATVFLLEAIYHLVVVGYSLFVLRRQATMLPSVKDGKDAIQVFLHNLGIAKEMPRMERYNFVEKAEYWAMAWGLIVMAVTGFMLWNPIATTNILPGQFIPAAKIAHGGEAVLAVLAIILWHFYSVHIKRFNKSMITGQMDRESMEEEHGLELHRIETGQVPPLPSVKEQRQRLQFFVPVAAVASIVSLVFVYWFVTFEKTAITTVPAGSQTSAFVPQTPTPVPTAAPTATPAPTEEGQAEPGGQALVGWNGDLDGIFRTRCGACHGSAGGFSAANYQDVMKEVVAGDPDASPVYSVQTGGSHPGLFTQEELARVKQWIEAGAPEQGASGPSGGSVIQPTTWDGGVKDILNRRCGLCHGTAGGYSVKSYAEAMEQIKAGDPEGSGVVAIHQGAHPAKLAEAELQAVIDWIRAGAPEK